MAHAKNHRSTPSFHLIYIMSLVKTKCKDTPVNNQVPRSEGTGRNTGVHLQILSTWALHGGETEGFGPRYTAPGNCCIAGLHSWENKRIYMVIQLAD